MKWHVYLKQKFSSYIPCGGSIDFRILQMNKLLGFSTMCVCLPGLKPLDDCVPMENSVIFQSLNT